MNQDEDAYNQFIDGQNDALFLLSPQDPKDYYYLMGWLDTKRKLAKGELCAQFEEGQAKIENPKNWEEF